MLAGNPLALLLLQLAVILVIGRGMGMLMARFRQPQVIGEIIAGLMLGPSLFGWVWPGAYAALFTDKAALHVLGQVAQLGVILFLFLVGLEFDTKLIRRYGKTAATVSVSGIMLPFVLGFGITFPLRHLFEGSAVTAIFPTALFMGAAMSVTAFPVLVRIITEWSFQHSVEGSLAIAAAAVDDVLAWSLLAVVVAVAGSANHSPLWVLVGAAAFLVVMFLVVRPLLKRVQILTLRGGRVDTRMMGLLLLTATLGAFATEMIGVHALFGAFVAGLVMPKQGSFVRDVSRQMQNFVIVFLLPLFFVYAGLKVDLRQLLHWDMLGYTALLTLIAVAGKLGGTSLAARASGLSGRQSIIVGILMNTRGLTELIILTVGLNLGVINARVYGMMVVMALVTTAMAAPLIRRINPQLGQAPVELPRATPLPA